MPVAAFGALALAFSLAALLHLRFFERDLRARVEGELGSVAELKVAQIVEWRQRLLQDVTALRENTPEASVILVLQGKADEVHRTAVQRRMRYRTARLHFALGALVDAQGRVLLATAPRPPAGEEELAALAEARRSGEAQLVDLAAEPGALRAVVPVGCGEAPCGAVVFSGRLDAALPAPVRSWPSPSSSAEAYLASVHGDEVLVLEALRNPGRVPAPARFQLRSAQFPLARAARGDEGVGRVLDQQGVPVLAARRRVPGSTWVLAAKENEAELLAPATEHAHAITIGLVAVLLACGAALAAWWRSARSELRRREREIEGQERLQRLQYAWKHAHDAVLIGAVGGDVVDANERALELYQVTRGELLDTPLAALWSGDELASVLRRLRGEPGGVVVEALHRRKDGSTFPVEVSSRLLASEGGELVYCIIRDVTERRAAAERARRDEERLRLALDATGAGIGEVDPSTGEVQLGARAAALLGRPGADRLDDLLAAVYPEDAAGIRERLGELAAGRAQRLVSEHRALVNGTPVWHRLCAQATERRGRAARVVFTVTDVSRERQLQGQLVFADRLASIGTLAAGVAHEINNPLSYLVSSFEFLDERLAGLRALTPEVAALASAVREGREGARRIAEIVRSLRTFSRRERDEGAHGPTSLREPVQAAVRMAATQVKTRARLLLDLGDSPPVAAADHEIAQIALNLLVNAAQAIPEGAASHHVVRVATRAAPDGGALLEVADTGEGIPPENLSRIFDPFFTTKPVGEGTGLGLAICHGIAERLGGRIEVESERGRGTTFRVLLPAAPLPAAGPPGPERASTRRGRVLVVDDDPLVCRAVARTLGAEHEVVTATDPREAMARLSRGDRFDVVVCDLMMPGVTGMDCWRELSRTRPELARNMIFLTGGAFTASAQAFLAEIGNVRMEKPFEAAALRAAVARGMAG